MPTKIKKLTEHKISEQLIDSIYKKIDEKKKLNEHKNS